MKKSLEQRLYEAYLKNSGALLTADDIFDLVVMDDAVGTRICNKAAEEAGGTPDGNSGAIEMRLPWNELGILFKG